jgi:hypothetical protein
MSNANLKALAPEDCFFVDETTTETHGTTWLSQGAWIALAWKAPGVTLRDFAGAAFNTMAHIRNVFWMIREKLKLIH